VGKKCEICNNMMVRDPLAEARLALDPEGKFKIFHCRNCGFRKLEPLPEKEYLEKIYADNYFEDCERGFSYASQVEETQYAFRSTAAKFRKLLNRHAVVLDIGCATGEFIDELYNVGLEAKGIEYSEYGAEICRSKGMDVFQGDMFQANYGQQRFDGIHMSHVLEHLADPNAVMEQLKKWIKPGGWIYIEVPLQFDGLLEKVQSYRQAPKQFDVFSVHHCSFFSPISLRMLIEKHGLEVDIISTFNPDKRRGRKSTVRKAMLSVFLSLANLIGRGDIIGVWIKA